MQGFLQFFHCNALYLTMVTKPWMLSFKNAMHGSECMCENRLWFTKMKVFCFKYQRWLFLIYSNNVCRLWLKTKQGIVSCQNKGHAWKKCYRCCRKCKPAVIFCECLQSAKTFSSALKRRRYFAYSTEQATFMQATW